MNKKVLIISSSPRKRGNSETLAAAFAKGAREAGNQVETVSLRDKQVGFCKGCLACLKLGHCVIQDDAVEIAAKMHDADVLVFATPVYYYCVSGQLKTMLDRANPLYDTDYAFTKAYLLAAAAEDASETFEGTEKAVQGWVDCFPRCTLAGTVFAGGVNGVGEIAGHVALEQAYQMGKEVFKQTAGREALGEFAPKFAELNDDVLFGQVWSREDKLSLRDRSIVTVVALMAQGLTDSSFQYHLTTAKNNGVTKTEIAEILTHAAFYAGWPKAWAAFRMAKEVWAEDDAADAKTKHANEMVFPIGAPNDAFAKYFVGQSYLAPLSTAQVGIYNVTFEPGCRNNWHIHHAKSGGGQILVCVAGCGYYQEWGKPAQELHPGDVVNIPVGVRHWHGAAPDSWFSHLALEVPGDETSNEWLEAVDSTTYFEAVNKKA